MYLDKQIDKTLLLNLQRTFVEANPGFFQDTARGSGAPAAGKMIYARLRAVDEMGLWVENRSWKTAPAGGKQEEHVLIFQIPFSALLSVGTFPKRVFVDGREEDSSDQRIGFLVGIGDDAKKT